MIGIGAVAALGLITVASIMAWKRQQSQLGGTLPEAGKFDPNSTWQPTYGPAMTTRAPHPDRPDTAAYLVAEGRVVRGFDMNRTPPHWGFDVSAPIGTLVYAAKGGRVVYAGRAPGYGIAVGISHAPNLSTWYAHLNRRTVNVGDTVRGGDIVGEVGRTTEGDEAITTQWGQRMGAHLHFEVHPTAEPRWQYQNAQRTEPTRWVNQQGIAPFGQRR